MIVSAVMGILAGIEVTNILYEEKLFPIFFTMNKFKEIAKGKPKSKLTNNQILDILIEKEKNKKNIKQIVIEKGKDILNILKCKYEFYKKFEVKMNITEREEDLALYEKLLEKSKYIFSYIRGINYDDTE